MDARVQAQLLRTKVSELRQALEERRVDVEAYKVGTSLFLCH